MPTPVRLTKRQLARLTGQTEAEGRDTPTKPQKGRSPSRKPVASHSLPPAVGRRYRVARDMQGVFTTPPLIGTVFTIWLIQGKKIYLDAPGWCIDISEARLRAFFEEVEE